MTTICVFHPLVIGANTTVLAYDVVARRPLVAFQGMDGEGIDLQVRSPRERSELVAAHIVCICVSVFMRNRHLSGRTRIELNWLMSLTALCPRSASLFQNDFSE